MKNPMQVYKDIKRVKKMSFNSETIFHVYDDSMNNYQDKFVTLKIC